MKVGLFFGSFNPIHTGHLIVANFMVEDTDLDEVWFVVSPRNPFKSSKSLLHEFDRIDMVERAIEDNPKFKAIDIEFHLPKPSYTITTLVQLREKYPQHQFILILGEDNLYSFPRWRNHAQILENHPLYIYPRPQRKTAENKENNAKILDHPHVKKVDAPLIEISATMIRQFVKKYRSIRYMVPDKVAQFISDRKFYQ